MATPDELKTAVHDEVHNVWEEMKKTLGERDAEVKDLGTATAETTQKLGEMESRLDERMEKLEAMRNRPGNHDGFDPDADEARAAMTAYWRKGDRGITPEYAKALATDVDAEGGYLIPDNIAPNIQERRLLMSPLRRLANVESISQGNALQMPKENAAFAAAWATERAARPETAAGTFTQQVIAVHEAYAKPLASQQMLEDAGFDVEGYITRKTGEAIGKLEATAFAVGDGTGKPKGVFAAGTGIASVTSGTVNTIKGDDILALLFALPASYAADAALLLARASVGTLRTQKDTAGQYIWSPGFGDQPATIFGVPYEQAVDAPAAETGAKAAIAADFKSLYTIVERKGINTLRDPYSSKPFVEFYTTFRVGGDVVDADAGRVLTIA